MIHNYSKLSIVNYSQVGHSLAREAGNEVRIFIVDYSQVKHFRLRIHKWGISYYRQLFRTVAFIVITKWQVGGHSKEHWVTHCLELPHMEY